MNQSKISKLQKTQLKMLKKWQIMLINILGYIIKYILYYLLLNTLLNNTKILLLSKGVRFRHIFKSKTLIIKGHFFKVDVITLMLQH